jgi:hypothetical protein
MSESTITDVSMAELRALLAELLRSQQDTDRRQKETDRQLREAERQMKEQTQATDRQLKQLGKQIGGLENKFGGFTEGLALPSMDKLLRQRFKMEFVAPRVRLAKNGESLEIDVLAYANGDINAVYVVEAKSNLREDSIEQMLETLRRLDHFLPEHRNKQLYGILAGVDIPLNVKAMALKQGLYLARIHDDEFTLDTPDNFTAKNFGASQNPTLP